MLVGSAIVVVVFVVAVIAIGQWAQGRVQTTIADRIEQQLPGSTASVRISSFPFLARLGAAGTVSRLTADVRDVRSAPSPVTLDRVHVDVRRLRLSRSDLLHRRVTIDGVGSAAVTATITQSSLRDFLRLPVTLGDGTVGVAGVNVPVHLAVDGREVTFSGPLGIHASFSLPSDDILPCSPAVQVVAGSLRLGCTLHQLPAFVAAQNISF